jgi:hypothetical protein
VARRVALERGGVSPEGVPRPAVWWAATTFWVVGPSPLRPRPRGACFAVCGCVCLSSLFFERGVFLHYQGTRMPVPPTTGIFNRKKQNLFSLKQSGWETTNIINELIVI